MDSIITRAASALTAMFPNGFDSPVAFRIGNSGSVTLGPDGVLEGEHDSDLAMTSDAETFAGILEGRLDPVAMYLSGRLRIEGNMQLAMQLLQRLKC